MKYQKVASIVIVSMLILIIHAFTLMRFPRPKGDEAWMSSRAVEFIRSGKSFGSLDMGVLDQYQGYENFNPLLSSAIQSFGIRLIGDSTLLAIRLVSLITGFTLLFSIYWIGSTLDGWKLGLLAAAFTAFSWSFHVSAHLGRPDIISATLGYTAIAIYLSNRSAKNWVNILVGIIAALAFEVHPNGIIYPLILIGLIFFQFRWDTFRKREFWEFAAGGAIGLLIYLSWHVFPNPSTFLRLNQIVFTFTHIPPIFTGDIEVLFEGLKNTVLLIARTYPAMVLVLWAIYRFRKSRPQYLLILLVINSILILSYALLVRNKFLLWYSIHLAPGLSLLIAAFFNDLLKSKSRTQYTKIFNLLLIAGLCLIPTLRVLRFNNYLPDYQQIQSQVNQAFEPGASILGYQLYWFGLKDHTYYSWENLVFYKRDNPDSSLEDAFRFLSPDYFILDNEVNYFLLEGEGVNNYYNKFGLSKTEMDTFLNRHAEIESVIENGDRKLEIYRIKLDN